MFTDAGKSIINTAHASVAVLMKVPLENASPTKILFVLCSFLTTVLWLILVGSEAYNIKSFPIFNTSTHNNSEAFWVCVGNQISILDTIINGKSPPPIQ